MKQAHSEALANSLSYVADADAAAKLERLQYAEAMSAEGVVLIALEAIRERFGARWDRRQDQVLEHAERTMRTRLSDADTFVRISSTEFIVCFARETGATAHAIAVHILEEVVLYFLGACAIHNLVVRTVRSIENGEIVAEPVEGERLERLRREASKFSASSGALAGNRETASSSAIESSAQPVSCNNGICVDYSLEEVTNLRSRSLAAQRIRRRLKNTLTGETISDSKLETVSTATLIKLEGQFLQSAISIAARQSPREARGLVVPLSIQFLSSTRGRIEFMRCMVGASQDLAGRLLVEIGGVGAGTPTSHLLEVLGFLRTRARAALVRPQLTKAAFAILGAARVEGISVELSSLGREPQQLAVNICAFATASRPLASMTLITGVNSSAVADCADAAGVTHIGAESGAFELLID